MNSLLQKRSEEIIYYSRKKIPILEITVLKHFLSLEVIESIRKARSVLSKTIFLFFNLPNYTDLRENHQLVK